MKLWGSSIDPSKATKYEVLVTDDDLLPPQEPPVGDPPTTTKILTKPTAHLPGDHGEAEGENTNPAFSTIQSSVLPTGTSSPGISSPEDVGWFPHMSSLVSSQKWFFVALGAVALFGIGAAIFFWRRRRARLASYTTLPAGDDVSMNALAGGRRSVPRHGPRPTKELYDAFGEVSDDEYDGDEEEKLLRSTQISAGVGFHSGFLDDDEQQPAGVYRDHPESTVRLHERGSVSPTPSPSGSGGSGGSWEHAS
jgi:kexin